MKFEGIACQGINILGFDVYDMLGQVVELLIYCMQRIKRFDYQAGG